MDSQRPATVVCVLVLDAEGNGTLVPEFTGEPEEGGAVIRFNAIVPPTGLNPDQCEYMRRTMETFLSILRRESQDMREYTALAENVIIEVNEVTSEDLAALKEPRGFYLMQTWTAEARLAQDRLPAQHLLQPKLSHVIRKLSALSHELQFGFIKGLRMGSRENWVELAKEARAKYHASGRATAPTSARMVHKCGARAANDVTGRSPGPPSPLKRVQ